ncbi:MAG: nucleotidyl transferase AbiEii/AbiGii toxin family protein [Novosphingobium sp.]|jgi:hypothetical protein|uniref:nucleotidyl transferase AbiEii/AbiGii toxin family protein n=1 Tax=Novosphingobium sp. TaxID=1874826 RepID=UPI0022C1F2B7|nr:nucleotidyl transferase AbiEii/AbiGii toxin family protein [Novosphingobium sp.]MCZ8036318.1 nucleotidyl transferase AbiEii/AbiGii toxin family protein [Novosphingobium sp.]
MAEVFLRLSEDDRREALGVAATASGRPAHLLEKDVWVVWALATLFDAPFADHLVFKGGTSLSKGYGVIRRFSEDVDLTYDIRALVPEFVGEGLDPLPLNRSQQSKWTDEVRQRLPVWIADSVIPVLQAAAIRDELSIELRRESDKVFIDYTPLAKGTNYVKSKILLEFGARSTGEPAEQRPVVCDAAAHLAGLSFPTASPRVMRAERTFWEKATAMHVFCLQSRMRGDRFSRHWHDLARLDEAGHADAALRDTSLATAVARHKAMFFAEKDVRGETIDYVAAVSGHLSLIPAGEALKGLADDYAHMVNDGVLEGEAESFETLMERCTRIEAKANARGNPAS